LQLYRRQGGEAERNLKRIENASNAQEKQNLKDEYIREQAIHKEEMIKIHDQQTEQGIKDMEEMNPDQQKEFIVIIGPVCTFYPYYLLF